MSTSLADQSFDLASLRAGYASDAFTAEEIITEAYRRIAAIGERPAWIALAPLEDALAAARAAPRSGPLYGIPFAVKDNIDVAGLPTTCGCPEFAYAPERSATIVERLQAAGAIVIGKTNLDQFATGLVGVRSPYGIPSCVFDAEYVSGGSSSGSAVSVANGCVSFALGTDTAGSGRVPAAFNNLVGLKPTKGWISTRGVVPACRTQDVVSIFALTVTDAAHVMAIGAAFDADDDYARPAAAFKVTAAPPKLRIGVPDGNIEFFGDTEAEALYRASIGRLVQLGAEIVPFDFTPFGDAARLLYAGPWVAERLAAIRKFAQAEPGAMDATVRTIILGADTQRAVDAFDAFYKLAALTRQAEAEWSKIDIMLLPTTGTIYKIADVLADPIALNSNLGTYTNFVNLMDLSALAIPAGFRSNGLPFGVTLLGRAFQDGMLADAGDRLHRTLSEQQLGNTAMPLSGTPAVDISPATTIDVAVVGAHLTGQPLNTQLVERRATLVREARTAPGYSFYALSGTVPAKPGLIFDGKGAGLIAVEIWRMPAEAFGSFVALIPAPLGIGTLKLDDGSMVKGFICEPYAAEDATDITRFGGWRNWLTSKSA